MDTYRFNFCITHRLLDIMATCFDPHLCNSQANFFVPMAQQPPVGQGLLVIGASRLHSRHATLGRTSLGKWSARRKRLYLTTHTRQTSMPLAGFEPATPGGERPQNHALDSAATWIIFKSIFYIKQIKVVSLIIFSIGSRYHHISK